jgi:hypothetical protein
VVPFGIVPVEFYESALGGDPYVPPAVSEEIIDWIALELFELAELVGIELCLCHIGRDHNNDKHNDHLYNKRLEVDTSGRSRWISQKVLIVENTNVQQQRIRNCSTYTII